LLTKGAQALTSANGIRSGNLTGRVNGKAHQLRSEAKAHRT
jgi:hypothetical protein